MQLAVQAAVLPSLCNSTEPAPLLQEMLDAGRLGVRSGQGFHDWTARSADELPRRRDLWLAERMKAALGRG